ncbi:MAG: hypothetical protein QOD71_2471 [Thermoleophilaceae bacterium]|jgi:hypothetical protein|nr:hypothetical protein [Thermoleophilaceae bacterium]
MNRFAAAPLTLIVLALGVASCGGGGGDAPSKAEYAADAEKICKDAEAQLNDVAQNPSTPEEIAAAVDQVIDATQQSVDKLKALEQPDGEAGRAAEKFVAAVKTDIEGKGIPALEELRDALKKNDKQAAEKAARRLQAVQTTESDKLARDIGATACGD